jgi:ABC-type multidrug transport system ATPase subunit
VCVCGGVHLGCDDARAWEAVDCRHATSDAAPYCGCAVRVGYCPGHSGFHPHFTVAENLRLFAALWKLTPKSGELLALCRSLGLHHAVSTIAQDLDPSAQRRLALAVATIARPDVLILDSPSQGMDPESQQLVWSYISKFRSATVIIGTASLEECVAVGGRMCVLANGRVTSVGFVDNLLRR